MANGNQRSHGRRTEAEFQNDVLLGHRVRAGRALRNMSQAALAGPLGLTWQQMNKYENASNRIGVSRLISIAHVLRLPVEFFFREVDLPVDPDAAETAEAIMLAQRIAALPPGFREGVEAAVRGFENTVAALQKAAE